MGSDKTMAILKNRVSIITGGAGGIGRAIAKKFLREGASVTIVDDSKMKIDEARSELEKITGNEAKLMGVMADISQMDEAQALVERTLSKFGSIDVLVNAAGIQGPIGPFLETNLVDWLDTIRINLFGTVLCCKSVLPIMLKQKRGKIINFSGGGATFSRPNFSAYATSKTGVVRFTEILADELRPFNIQVNAISPGVIKTRMIDEIVKAGPEKAGSEYEQAMKKMVEGFDSPESAADLACFLASDQSDWITGKVISAIWDPWKEWREKGPVDFDKDSFVLRRIDQRNFIKVT